MNRRQKFDAASFILGGEIRNRTNTQTVNDISAPCLSACVDNQHVRKLNNCLHVVGITVLKCRTQHSTEQF